MALAFNPMEMAHHQCITRGIALFLWELMASPWEKKPEAPCHCTPEGRKAQAIETPCVSLKASTSPSRVAAGCRRWSSRLLFQARPLIQTTFPVHLLVRSAKLNSVW